MKLLLKVPYGNTLSDAFAFARDRGILPTWMGTQELRDLEAGIKERAVFSARTTNAVYLQALHDRIQRFIADGYEGDQAKLRLELQQVLAELAYDPETGFPGDAELGIPPARAGSLQDLSSDRRINLILETQMQLIAGKGQQQRGLEPAALDLFPAYELVRVKAARVPRNWQQRWEDAGGTLINDEDGRVRMVALKTSEIWSLLGDPAIFPDALGVSYPPFCWGSGMAWEDVDADEWDRLWLIANPDGEEAPQPGSSVSDALAGKPVPQETAKKAAEVKQLPPAVVSTSGLSMGTLARLKATLANAEAKDGRLSLKSIYSAPPPPPPPSRMQINAERLLTYAAVEERLNAKRCGRSWIPDWKKCRKDTKRGGQGDKGASLIGQEGTAESLGLPDLHDIPRYNVSHRAQRDEARALIESGTLSEADPVGRKVTFGKITMGHLKHKEAANDMDRARWLTHARRAIEAPLEIWEYRHRHYYLSKSVTGGKAKPFTVVAARVGERENEVISFHPSTWTAVQDDRQGKLLYTAY